MKAHNRKNPCDALFDATEPNLAPRYVFVQKSDIVTSDRLPVELMFPQGENNGIRNHDLCSSCVNDLLKTHSLHNLLVQTDRRSWFVTILQKLHAEYLRWKCKHCACFSVDQMHGAELSKKNKKDH